MQGPSRRMMALHSSFMLFRVGAHHRWRPSLIWLPSHCGQREGRMMNTPAKQLINNPEDVVEEALQGMLATAPHALRRLERLHVLVRADYERLKQEGKVALLSGGGSGHEPAHAGYIGEGMLTGAVLGGIFASPSVSSIVAAIRVVTGPAGTLLILKNYTGDRLNFGMAREQALAEGLKVDIVFVADDCALPKAKGITGRRGVAGTVLVHKVAGAAACEGLPLEAVKAEAEAAAQFMGTLGIALTTCTIPGGAPSGRLDPDLIELGMGIHGEPGIERTKMMPADAVTERMINAIVADEAHGGHDYLPLSPGERVILVVNNLGGTPPIELSIVTRCAVHILEDKLKARVERVFVGAFMTSLDMAGVSLTIARVDDLRLSRLDAPTTAPAWMPAGPRPSTPTSLSVPVPAGGQGFAPTSSAPADLPPKPLPPSDLQQYVKVIVAVARAISDAKDYLNALDAASGDGDCGVTLDRGAKEVMLVVSGRAPVDGVAGLVQRVAEAIGRAMGGTSGALLEILFRAMSRSLRQQLPAGGTPTTEQWTNAFAAGVEALQYYGNAREGYRTMLDAWVPALDGLRQEGIEGFEQGARLGAERTKDMEACAGRANYVPFERVKGKPDPGAAAVAIAAKAALDALRG